MDSIEENLQLVIPLPKDTPKDIAEEVAKRVIADIYTNSPRYTCYVEGSTCRVKCEFIEKE